MPGHDLAPVTSNNTSSHNRGWRRRAQGQHEPSRRLLAAATAASQRGWPVIPLRPGTKIPAIPRWEAQASSDPDQLCRWWDAAAYNVGIACGPAQLVVVDLDALGADEEPVQWGGQRFRHGRDLLAALAEQLGELDPIDTYRVASPSNGQHRYFQAPPGIQLRNTVGQRGRGLGPLIDIRSHGGLITAAGSVIRTPSGARYYQTEPGAAVDPEPLPRWLIDKLTPPPVPAPRPIQLTGGGDRDQRVAAYVDAALRGELAKIIHAQVHSRAHTVFAAAAAIGELVGAGALDATEAEAALLQAAAVHSGTAGWTDTEARHHIRNGLARGTANPRRLTSRPD